MILLKNEDPRYHYNCYQIKESVKIDGKLKENLWRNCPKSPRFGDIVDGRPGFYQTQASLCWDHQNLYVGFWIQEPFLAAELSERDSRVYLENDIEVFIAGEHCYYEFQINALGTVYEVFYIIQSEYHRNKFDKILEFSLNNEGVDILGGFQDNMRYSDQDPNPKWAFRNFNFPGLLAKVDLQGTLNDHSDIDKGWTVEIAFPWEGMKYLFHNRNFPPKDGDILRMDFSRFEKLYVNGNELNPHPGWTWSPHGVYDSHLPDKFTYIHFSEEFIDEGKESNIK